nr:OmpA family protein [Sphingomonas melonis]
MLIAETKPLQITAKILPASALKAQIDKTGKVALHVNFATDKTDILPDSQPQIEQVVQLLKQDPVLKLAINGYTDATGDPAHNKTLSEGRAKAVAAAIIAKGIDRNRLSAAGFGDADPVADNATEEGKAQNRRVELVKRS